MAKGGLCAECLHDRIQISRDYFFNMVPFFPNAVVGNPILGEIVCAYFFGPVCAANLFFAVCSERVRFGFPLSFMQFSPKDGERGFAVRVL